MKFNLIHPNDCLEKLYYEVMGLAHATIRNNMDFEAWNNGMRANTIDEASRFHFLDKESFDQDCEMQNSFIFLHRIYNANVILVYKGEYYIPITVMGSQYQKSWDFVITPCLLPVYVETDDTMGLSTNNIPSYSWTINRRELNDFSEDDGLGETLRIDLPERIFPQLIINPFFLNPPLDDLVNTSFDSDIVHLDYNKPLNEVEIANDSIFRLNKDAEVDSFFTLAYHAMERPYPNMFYVCQRLEQAAALNSLEAAMILVYSYYYGTYGVEKNYDKAIEYILQVMSFKDPDLVGYEILYADCYRYGRGVEQNIDKAIELFSSLLPNPWAYFNLAYIYATGENVEVDITKASEYLSMSKQNGLFEDLKRSYDETRNNNSSELIDCHNDIVKEIEHITKVLSDNRDTEAIKGLETISQFYISEKETQE